MILNYIVRKATDFLTMWDIFEGSQMASEYF